MRTHKIGEVNMSFLLMLVFTIVSSLVAYQLVNRAYDTVFAISAMEIAE